MIGDVPRCTFDPVVTLCRGIDAPTCLTPPQVEAARKIYPGSELGRVPGSGLGLQDAADQLRLRPDGVEPPPKNFNFDALSLIER